MSDGLDIPITTPGAPAAAEALEKVAVALERTGQKASEAGRSMDTLRRAADTFNEVHAAVSTLASGVERMTTRIAELATEESNLRELSARMGLDFDRAAGAAGRFADETTAMGVAGRAAASDIRLTQTELDAVMRLAGSKAVELGTTVQGAAEMLTEALVRGREGGLQRFGAGLSDLAGEGHTVQERLAGVVAEAGRTAAATDTAADRVLRYRDALEDAQRSAASAFVTEAARLAAVSSAAHGATVDADDLKVKMQAVGATAAYVLTQTGNLAQVVVGVIGVAMAPLLTGLDVAAAGIAALSSNGPAAAARAMAAAAQEGRATQAARFAADGLRGFRDAYNASNDQRTTAPSDVAPAAAGGGAGRGSDMTFGNDEATQILGRRRAAGGGRHNSLFQQTDETRRTSALAFGAKQREEESAYLAEQHRRAEATASVIAEDLARVRAANDNERGNERGKGAEQSRLNRQEQERERAASTRGYLEDQAASTVNLRDITVGAFDAMGAAATSHFEALVNGSETAGAALQGFVHDSLSALAKIAAQQAVFELGKGFAALFTNPVAAPAHFAAAALFGVAAAAAGGLAQATAPSAAGGGSAGGSQRAASVSPQRASDREGGGVQVVNNYYAPRFGGREGTEAEAGTRMNRYTSAERRRTDREAA
jgi:hypothetical protein